jgi:outer membrane biosynthesis protein TonB
MRSAFAFLILSLSVVACVHKPVAEPKVDAKWVEQVSRDHNHQVLKCYETALKKDRKLQGHVLLELDATVVGAVRDVRVKDSLSPDFDACVVAAAKSWTYPWLKSETLAIQENYRLYLNADGQPMSEFSGPGMDKEVVRATVKAHLPEVQQCYSNRLRRMPGLAGKLVLQWDILGSGEVTNVTVKQSLDPQVDKCVAEKLAKWKFPQPPNNMVANVSYPFQFMPATAK